MVKLREEAIKSILKQSLRSIPPTRKKRPRCLSLRVCCLAPAKRTRALSRLGEMGEKRYTSSSSKSLGKLLEDGVADDKAEMTLNMSTIKDMVEMTCDSNEEIDTEAFDDKDEYNGGNCICGGFSFLSRARTSSK